MGRLRPTLGGSRGREMWIVLGLLALAIGLPAIVGIVSGAISAPRNDDFAYRRAALMLFEHGRLEFTGWAVMTLVGQLAATIPLLWLTSGSAAAFATTTSVFAVIAILASYSVARRVLSPGRAGLAVLLAVLVPGFLLYTTAYMTEVPAFAMEMSCLAIGAVALERSSGADRWRWLAASLVVGCYAFSIREYALAAPLAVLAAAAASDRQGRRAPYLLGLVAVGVVCAAIYVWTAGLPGQGDVGLAVPTPHTTRRVLDAIGVISLTLAPAIVVAAGTWVPRWWRSRERTGAAMGGFIGLGIGTVVYLEQLVTRIGGPGGPDIFVGNVFDRYGSLGVEQLAGRRPELFASPWWDLLNDLAIVATFCGLALLGAALVVERHRLMRALDLRSVPTPLGTVPGMVALFAVIFAAGTAFLGLTVIIFDRYTWPLALPLAVILLRPPGGKAAENEGRTWSTAEAAGQPAGRAGQPIRMWVAAVVLVAVAAATSLALLLDEAAFDGARWRIGDEAVALGFAPDTVDAGLEWVGLHATGPVQLAARQVPDRTGYSVKFPSFRACAIVSSSPLDWVDVELVVKRFDAYRLLLVVGPSEPLYLYRVVRPGCPSGQLADRAHRP
jgi:hypothetical protein